MTLRTANACHWWRCDRHCCLLDQCPWLTLLQLLHKPQHCLPQSHCRCLAAAQTAGHAALGADMRQSGLNGLPQMLSHPSCACCAPIVSACCCQLRTSSPCADDISAAEAEAQTILPFCLLRHMGHQPSCQHHPEKTMSCNLRALPLHARRPKGNKKHKRNVSMTLDVTIVL